MKYGSYKKWGLCPAHLVLIWWYFTNKQFIEDKKGSLQWDNWISQIVRWPNSQIWGNPEMLYAGIIFAQICNIGTVWSYSGSCHFGMVGQFEIFAKIFVNFEIQLPQIGSYCILLVSLFDTDHYLK